MLLLITSFLAGVLTVLAPCVLPILPIIVGGSVEGKSKAPAIRLIASLSISIVVFTLLLRATTLLIDVPQSFWAGVSGTILIIFGLITLFPEHWEKISGKLSSKSQGRLQKAANKKGWQREVWMGAALGPVFTSCSPTYALIIATILPASFVQGVFYTIVYAAGLATVLFAIAMLGRRLTKHMQVAADPKGKFKKVLGWIFLIVGIFIFMGWDKDVETYIIDQGYFGVTSFEETLLERMEQE